jgi:putative membrane protein
MSIAMKGLIASALLGGVLFAQDGTSNNMTSMTSAGIPAADRSFMYKAAQGGMAEVELGQLAQQNAENANVKAFGQRMVTDHSKANDQLKQLAAQQGVSLPATLDAKERATKARLAKLHGAAFDKAYMQDMVMDHKQDVAEFKHESTAAKTPALRDWAQQTEPTLESHLMEAEKIAPQVGVSGAASAKMGQASEGVSAQSH